MIEPYQVNPFAANFVSQTLINDLIRARIACDMPYFTQAFRGNQRLTGFQVKGLNMDEALLAVLKWMGPQLVATNKWET